MLGFGKAMVDVGMGAGVYESVSSEGFLARDQLLDLGAGFCSKNCRLSSASIAP